MFYQASLCDRLINQSPDLYPTQPTRPQSIQLAETLASGEAAALVEEGLWDMAREVVRAYEAGEMPKGAEGACLWVKCTCVVDCGTDR